LLTATALPSGPSPKPIIDLNLLAGPLQRLGPQAQPLPGPFQPRLSAWMMGTVTTGWDNEPAKDAVRRTLRGGGSGRITVFVIAAIFLGLGISGGNLFLSVAGGVAASR